MGSVEKEESPPVCCSPLFPMVYAGRSIASKVHRPLPNQNMSAKESRRTFATTTYSSILPSSLFTNHESLPPLSVALSNFLSAYPNYPLTQLADRLRLLHYPNLSLHIPLDYAGFPLFAPSQRPASSSFTVAASSQNAPPPAEHSSSVEQEEEEEKGELECAIKRRIMSFLNLSQEEYLILLTVNRASALKLLAESYPFHSHKRLLTVYDHKSEAVSAMLDASSRRQAKLMSASFKWPSMRIKSSKLSKMLSSINSSGGGKGGGGLFLFPLQSMVTGTRYSYLWLTHAQRKGWHVALDACGLGPKDMDTLGLSLFRPDFLVCNFFKVFGEDPSGFSCLVVRRDNASLLQMASPAECGLVRIVPTAAEPEPGGSTAFVVPDLQGGWQEGVATASSSEIIEEEPRWAQDEERPVGMEFRGLDHADSLGLELISGRLRCIVNWLVVALTKLQHPHSGSSRPLVRIYGALVKFDRGNSIAFNLFDWKGEKVDPSLVQKLADRSNISLSCSFLHNIFFSNEAKKEVALEKRPVRSGNKAKVEESWEVGIAVATLSLGFLASFDDAYNLWAFIAKFLDADFVQKERWRDVALNQPKRNAVRL